MALKSVNANPKGSTAATAKGDSQIQKHLGDGTVTENVTSMADPTMK